MTLKLIYPALAQILWSFVVLVIMFRRRKRAFANREVGLADIAVSTERYPDTARLAAANFSNQFETPVLFFALILIAIHVGATGYVMAMLAWAYVATRIVHTLVHTGTNSLKQRALVFAAGIACLFFMWVGIVIAVL
ncbi:MAPEG family protein [Bosea sp. (in: a-proteobacteria)]|uniref:MAPEG family protein n=1 Tax=Bosea sp. (in: a-proteobacteria) TaxID=1871050 RepID=UPI002DDD0220|nr:MAPEG family protein [Bosea sp. (in: a-proteobacteria)]HEV2509729.1 MAPEG family protein [Bosea sp. (in: a-proteobacteria)]